MGKQIIISRHIVAMFDLALSGDPRPILTDYLLANHANEVLHYLPNTDEEGIVFTCAPNEKGKMVRRLRMPSKETTDKITKRINESTKDFVLFHIILEQKDDCTKEMDGRKHGVMLLYNRTTRRVYIYDILRYNYRGFKVNVLNTQLKKTFLPWLEVLDYSRSSLEYSGSEGSNTEVRLVQMDVKDTSKMIIQYMSQKLGREANGREWYPLLAILEIFTMLMQPEALRSEIIEMITDGYNEEDRKEILDELYDKFMTFAQNIYSIYDTRCGDRFHYEPEISKCISMTTKSRGTRTGSKTNIDVGNKGFVDSPDVRYRIGTEYGQVVMMMYFTNKYPRCVPFLPKKINWNIRKTDYAISWAYDVDSKEWMLDLPNRLTSFLKRTVGNPNKDHIIILLRLKSKPKENGVVGFHLNSLLYNRATGEIEHFEPHGTELMDTYGAELLYMRLRDYFAKTLPTVTYVPPSGFCLHEKFFQKQEADELGFISEYGMCAVWAIWYIDVRLSNPTLTRDEVVKHAMKALHKYGSFRTFIRNYEKYHLHMIEYITTNYIFEPKNKRSSLDLDPSNYIPSS